MTHLTFRYGEIPLLTSSIQQTESFGVLRIWTWITGRTKKETSNIIKPGLKIIVPDVDEGKLKYSINDIYYIYILYTIIMYIYYIIYYIYYILYIIYIYNIIYILCSKACFPADVCLEKRRLLTALKSAAPWASPASEARSHSAGPPQG